VKLFEITIKPALSFATPLKGDTLFGHFCWQAAYDPGLLNGGLEKWISLYRSKPYAVFSTAFPKFFDNSKCWYALRKPNLPLSAYISEHDVNKSDAIKKRKKAKKKKWMKVHENLLIDMQNTEYFTDMELPVFSHKQASMEIKKTMDDVGTSGFCLPFVQPHNTINRLTSTTGEGPFAPYSVNACSYYPETELAVFCLIDEEATDIDRICTGLERIGMFGFGKDASIGSGKFQLGDRTEIDVPTMKDADACLTLAPSVPGAGEFREGFFTPFTRFGKHGDVLAKSMNPFKNPIIMADEGAVFVADSPDVFRKPYMGTAISDLSKAQPQSVHQGYAPYLPLKIGELP